MLVVYPYTKLDEEAIEALDNFAPRLSFFRVVGPDDYYELFRTLWSVGKDFINIEHDIVIHEKVISEFDECPFTWCVFPYEHTGNIQTESLGCVRFSAELMEAVPGALEEVKRMDSTVAGSIFEGVPATNWRLLDSFLRTVLMGYGYTPHVHYPMVKHNHREELNVPLERA